MAAKYFRKNKKALPVGGWIFAALISIASSPTRADLVDDPAEDASQAPPSKETSKGTSGSASSSRDEIGGRASTPTQPTATPKKDKDKDKDEKTQTEQKKPAKSDKNTAKSNENSNAPIKYRSVSFAGQKDGGIVVLEQDVVVTQADMRIEADKATLHFDQVTNEVIDCVAVGNVHFYRKDPETGNPVTAEGKEAIFNNKERTVLLKGDPKLVRGGDVVRGRQIRYDLVTGWVKADRVEGVVQPTKQESNKTTNPAKSPSASPSVSPSPWPDKEGQR